LNKGTRKSSRRKKEEKILSENPDSEKVVRYGKCKKRRELWITP